MGTKYLIVESPVNGQEVLLAGVLESKNVKTGDMVQIHILHPDDKPTEISKRGLDDRVCGTCPLRHSLKGSCYVNIGQGPNSVYRGWVTHGKQVDSYKDFVRGLEGRKVRFGAYGDPSHIPPKLAALIMRYSKGHTAYTHDWRLPEVGEFWKGKAMASCDTIEHLREAEALGWKGFVAAEEDIPDVRDCLNETKGLNCIDCLICDGSKVSIQIRPHGAWVNRHPGKDE
jgi:hypothetical protein